MSIIQISQKAVSAVASNPECTERMLQSALADIASALPSSVAKPPAYQPIASAPKDGTKVFLWLDDAWVAAKWRESGPWQSAYSGRFLTLDPDEIEWWMPHPEPPEPEVRG
jgi:hypothetical protein